MMTPIARAARGCTALIGGALIVSACGSNGADGGGVGAALSGEPASEGEARALDEAAEMLEQNRLPDGVVPDIGAADAPPDDAPQPGASQADPPSPDTPPTEPPPPDARGTVEGASD
ncbi:MAG: hypothetical protein AAFY07_11435 [Pseudomonadota bacterium]